MTEYHLGGAFEIQVAKADANAYPVGQEADPTNIANGAEMHAYRRKGFITAGTPALTYGEITWTGSMTVRGKMTLGLSDVGSFPITVSSYDDTFDTMVMGGAVDTSGFGTQQRLLVPNWNNPNPPQVWIILTTGAERASDKAKGFMHYAYLGQFRVDSRPEINSTTGVNPMPFTYTFVPTSSTRLISGELVSASDVAVENDEAWVQSWFTETHRVGLSSYKDDNGDTAMLLGYRPTRTDSDNSYNVFTNAGANAASNVGTITAATKSVAITAQAAASMWVSLYHTRFQS
jgi:hypothetical protein